MNTIHVDNISFSDFLKINAGQLPQGVQASGKPSGDHQPANALSNEEMESSYRQTARTYGVLPQGPRAVAAFGAGLLQGSLEAPPTVRPHPVQQKNGGESVGKVLQHNANVLSNSIEKIAATNDPNPRKVLQKVVVPIGKGGLQKGVDSAGAAQTGSPAIQSYAENITKAQQPQPQQSSGNVQNVLQRPLQTQQNRPHQRSRNSTVDAQNQLFFWCHRCAVKCPDINTMRAHISHVHFKHELYKMYGVRFNKTTEHVCPFCDVHVSKVVYHSSWHIHVGAEHGMVSYFMTNTELEHYDKIARLQSSLRKTKAENRSFKKRDVNGNAMVKAEPQHVKQMVQPMVKAPNLMVQSQQVVQPQPPNPMVQSQQTVQPQPQQLIKPQDVKPTVRQMANPQPLQKPQETKPVVQPQESKPQIAQCPRPQGLKRVVKPQQKAKPQPPQPTQMPKPQEALPQPLALPASQTLEVKPKQQDEKTQEELQQRLIQQQEVKHKQKQVFKPQQVLQPQQQIVNSQQVGKPQQVLQPQQQVNKPQQVVNSQQAINSQQINSQQKVTSSQQQVVKPQQDMKPQQILPVMKQAFKPVPEQRKPLVQPPKPSLQMKPQAKPAEQRLPMFPGATLDLSPIAKPKHLEMNHRPQPQMIQRPPMKPQQPPKMKAVQQQPPQKQQLDDRVLELQTKIITELYKNQQKQKKEEKAASISKVARAQYQNLNSPRSLNRSGGQNQSLNRSGGQYQNLNRSGNQNMIGSGNSASPNLLKMKGHMRPMIVGGQNQQQMSGQTKVSQPMKEPPKPRIIEGLANIEKFLESQKQQLKKEENTQGLTLNLPAQNKQLQAQTPNLQVQAQKPQASNLPVHKKQPQAQRPQAPNLPAQNMQAQAQKLQAQNKQLQALNTPVQKPEGQKMTTHKPQPQKPVINFKQSEQSTFAMNFKPPQNVAQKPVVNFKQPEPVAQKPVINLPAQKPVTQKTAMNLQAPKQHVNNFQPPEPVPSQLQKQQELLQNNNILPQPILEGLQNPEIAEGLAEIQKLIQFQAKKLMFENILKKQSQMFNLAQQQSEASKIEEGFGTTEGIQSSDNNGVVKINFEEENTSGAKRRKLSHPIKCIRRNAN